MKYLFLLFAFIFSCSISYAQTRYEKEFIRFAIGTDNITYPANVGSGWINDVKESLSKDTLFDYLNTFRYEKIGLPDSLIFVLTSEEQAYIQHELDQNKSFVWKSNVVKHSLAIDYEKLKIYKQEHGGKLNYDPNDYKNGSYMFAKPIFIRNKQVCFFLIIGKDDVYLRMYVRKNGTWKLKFNITHGILD